MIWEFANVTKLQCLRTDRENLLMVGLILINAGL